MHSKPIRMAVVALGLLVTVAGGYWAFNHEESLERERRDAALATVTVGKTLELLLDVRASLHAYVAPTQALPFWAKRAQESIEALRQTLTSLEGIAAPIGQPLAESLAAVDQLAVSERRARAYAGRGELLLAGDVIFTEIRDLLAVATNQVDGVRSEFQRRHEQRSAARQSGPIVFASAAVAIWIAIALFLMPIEPKPAMKDPAEWRRELKETLSKPVQAPAALDPAPVAPPAPLAPIEPSVTVASIRETSEICADLSALSDPGALEGTLARVSSLLEATGLIVWIASEDGTGLSPVAIHGFDPALVARIGKVPRDGANLTAAALRDNAPKVSAPTDTAPAALAVAMCSPSGPVGVLSIELKSGRSVDDAKVALASIFAAQLATLTMAIPEAQLEIEEARRAAI